MVEPMGSYIGHATINGYGVDLNLIAQANTVRGTCWSGTAHVLDPAVDLLEFTNLVTLEVNGTIAHAQVTDATPATRYVYLRGAGQPPFALG